MIKKFWNNCDLHFAHNIIGGYLKDYSTITKKWCGYFIDKIDFKNKIVLDYGIGGAYLGKFLLDKKEIKYYHGVDISERSLFKANEILKPYDNTNLIITDNYYSDFDENIDIFISQACIQHFPNEKYLIQFLEKINNIKPNTVILQITLNKFGTTIFNNKDYKYIKDVVRACYTTEDFLLKYLDNYKISFKNDKIANRGGDFSQYLFFKFKN